MPITCKNVFSFQNERAQRFVLQKCLIDKKWPKLKTNAHSPWRFDTQCSVAWTTDPVTDLNTVQPILCQCFGMLWRWLSFAHRWERWNLQPSRCACTSFYHNIHTHTNPKSIVKSLRSKTLDGDIEVYVQKHRMVILKCYSASFTVSVLICRCLTSNRNTNSVLERWGDTRQ